MKTTELALGREHLHFVSSLKTYSSYTTVKSQQYYHTICTSDLQYYDRNLTVKTADKYP
jgi:hypothetical protein